MSSFLLAADVSVGDHITRTFLGMTIDLDTVIATLVAGGIVLLIGLYLRMRATAEVPGRLQLAFETIVGQVQSQVKSSMGDAGKPVVPLAFTLFVLILFANLLEMLPTGHSPQYLPPPSADVNFTFALAFTVIIAVHVTWIRRQGFGRYISHYVRPQWWLLPINVIEEITKPITLALRLFGNIFAGGILLVIIADAIPAKYIVPIPVLDVIWKLFDGLFVGPLQAFIFALLTVLYFEAPIAGGH
jgi:F-type H+-transporting ATPase subunit a